MESDFNQIFPLLLILVIAAVFWIRTKRQQADPNNPPDVQMRARRSMLRIAGGSVGAIIGYGFLLSAGYYGHATPSTEVLWTYLGGGVVFGVIAASLAGGFLE